jgi:type IV pilus assembly protein PilA
LVVKEEASSAVILLMHSRPTELRRGFTRLRSAQLRRGFTLIELLLVIAILASIVIVAINPTKQLGDARDSQRRSDVNTLLNGIYEYAIDHGGNLPPGIPVGMPKPICQSDFDPSMCVAAPFDGVSLRMLSGSYLTNIPKDPLLTSTGTGTRYSIMQDGAGRITVTAPAAERSSVISVTH